MDLAMTECLFVGGPADGEIRDVTSIVRAHHIATRSESIGFNVSEVLPPTLEHHTYYPMRFSDNGDVLTVFIHESINQRGPVMKRILYGYAGHATDSKKLRGLSKKFDISAMLHRAKLNG